MKITKKSGSYSYFVSANDIRGMFMNFLQLKKKKEKNDVFGLFIGLREKGDATLGNSAPESPTFRALALVN